MGRLFLLFTLVPIVELFLLIRIGRVIGPGTTILFVIAVGVLGAWMAKSQGRKVIREWQAAMAEGRVPTEGVLSGLLVLIGGMLLITPGVITDFMGLLLLLPATRRMATQAFRRHLEKQIQRGNVQVHTNGVGFAGPAGAPRRSPNAGKTRFDPRFGQVIDTEGERIE